MWDFDDMSTSMKDKMRVVIKLRTRAIGSIGHSSHLRCGALIHPREPGGSQTRQASVQDVTSSASRVVMPSASCVGGVLGIVRRSWPRHRASVVFSASFVGGVLGFVRWWWPRHCASWYPQLRTLVVSSASCVSSGVLGFGRWWWSRHRKLVVSSSLCGGGILGFTH